METKIDTEEIRHTESLYKVLTDLAEQAWLNGIKIDVVSFQAGLVHKRRGNFEYKYIMPIPKIKKFHTPYGEIKIK